MLVVLLAGSALVGLVVGSFLTAVIHRVPSGVPVLRPGPHCPRCASPIRARHAVPVLGWLALRGRCADCGGPIGARYLVVELVTAALFLLSAWLLWTRGQLPLLPAVLYLVGAGIALSLIDVDVHRLPNAIVLPGYPVLAALLLGATAVSGDWAALLRAGVGAAILLGFYLIITLIHPAGMGWGDVKLSGLLGAVLGYVGWTALLVGAVAGFASGAVVAAAAMAIGRAGRRTALPFGPFMFLGTAFGVTLGDWLGTWYLTVAGV